MLYFWMDLSPRWLLLLSGPRFGVRLGVLSWDLVGSRGRGIGGFFCRIHRGMTTKSHMLIAPPCINNSWGSTTLSLWWNLPHENRTWEWCHVHFIRDLHITYIHRVMWPSKNPIDFFFNAKNYFKSKWNRDSTASYHNHRVCQYPGEDMVKLASVWRRVLGTNRIIGTWHWSLGGNVTLMKIISRKKFINFLPTVHFLTLIHINYLDIMWKILIYIKKWNFDWNKNIADKFVSTNDPIIWIFPILIGAHSQTEVSGRR